MGKRRRNIILGFIGVGAMCVIFACVGAYFVPRIMVAFAGFGDGQQTEDVLGQLSDGGLTIEVLDNNGGELVITEGVGANSEIASSNTTSGGSVAVAPTPAVVVQELDQVTVQLDGQQETVDLNAMGVDQAAAGITTEGNEVYYFEYDETSINEVFQSTVWPEAPPEVTNQVQNVSIDLKPNAVIVSGQANLGLGSQQIAVILGIDGNNARFKVIGVDIGGMVFSTPPDGPIGDMISELEIEGNRALSELVLYGNNGNPLNIENIAVEDGRIRVTAE